MIGTAVVLIRDNQLPKILRYCLGWEDIHSVYESELVATAAGLHLLKKERIVDGKVSLDSDSQPVIKGTKN